MKILVVGAGSVGQVYARHFQRGGAEVAFLVKEKHAAEARRGFTMYPLRESGRAPVRFEGFDVLTALDGSKWDAIVLCVSSPAIRGKWLDELAAGSGDATIVMLQPGLTDHAYVAERVGAGRLVSGLIGFMAYAAPLPGEKGSGAGHGVLVSAAAGMPAQRAGGAGGAHRRGADARRVPGEGSP